MSAAQAPVDPVCAIALDTNKKINAAEVDRTLSILILLSNNSPLSVVAKFWQSRRYALRRRTLIPAQPAEVVAPAISINRAILVESVALPQQRNELVNATIPQRIVGDDAVKSRLLGSVALSALLASPVLAADLRVKAPPPPPPPAVFSWTGFYVGLNAGAAWGRSDVETSVSCDFVPGFAAAYFCFPGGGQANAAAIAAAGTGSMSGSGFTGGGQIGYNLQSGNVVFGAEFDVEAFNLKLSRQASGAYLVSVLPGLAGNTFTVTSSLDTRWLFTARARLGLAFDSVLVFATGGLAVTDLRASHTFSDTHVIPAIGAGAWSGSKTKTGWTAGGGIEWAAGRYWTVKVEYLYLNFGSVDAAGLIVNPSPVGYANAISTSADLTAHIARAGINFRF